MKKKCFPFVDFGCRKREKENLEIKKETRKEKVFCTRMNRQANG